jgi:hypothetical protein
LEIRNKLGFEHNLSSAYQWRLIRRLYYGHAEKLLQSSFTCYECCCLNSFNQEMLPDVSIINNYLTKKVESFLYLRSLHGSL